MILSFTYDDTLKAYVSNNFVGDSNVKLIYEHAVIPSVSVQRKISSFWVQAPHLISEFKTSSASFDIESPAHDAISYRIVSSHVPQLAEANPKY